MFDLIILTSNLCRFEVEVIGDKSTIFLLVRFGNDEVGVVESCRSAGALSTHSGVAAVKGDLVIPGEKAVSLL